MTPPPIQSIHMRGITKRFPGVLANDQVDFEIQAGEIHALLGENGAGKSTLMRQLYGMYKPDGGQILVDGQPVHFYSPADAIGRGIGMIHQHFMLVNSLTVAENVALGLRSRREPRLDLDRVSQEIRQLAERYGLKVDPNAYIWQLAVGEQQRVEILKALYRGASLLILDEPTAVLTPQEVDDLFKTLREMAASGKGLIFISHKLHEVLALCDRISVLRNGRHVDTRPKAGVTRGELARLMVGREIETPAPQSMQGERVRLKVDNLWARGDRGVDVLRGVSLEIREGEILGLAGVSGNGQRELADTIAGLRKATRGHIYIDEAETTGLPPVQLLTAGLSYIPEERMREGAIRDFSVLENLLLQDHSKPPFARGGFLNFRLIGQYAQKLTQEFSVKTPSLDTPIKNLSGGNIQKVIMARELARQPKVLIAAQPTRGVDIGASEYIHQRLLAQRASGTATLLISEDLDELRALSDRIAVIYEGEIMGVLPRQEASAERLGLLMAGVR